MPPPKPLPLPTRLLLRPKKRLPLAPPPSSLLHSKQPRRMRPAALPGNEPGQASCPGSLVHGAGE